MKKNDKIIGTCIGYNHEGLGIVVVEEQILFVPGLIRGERARIKILKCNKRNSYGRIIEVLEASFNRIQPPCIYFPKCGGCQLQYMNQEEQAYLKTKYVADNIKKIAKSSAEILPTMMMECRPYRNKAQFPVKYTEQLEMGFYRRHSNDLIDIDYCMIQSDVINECYKKIKDICCHYEEARKLRHLLIKHAYQSEEIMIVLIASDDSIKKNKKLIQQISESSTIIKSIILNINTRNDNVILGDQEVLLYGTSTIREQLLGLQFQISATSFFQVNPFQTEVLYKKALEFAQVDKETTVLDMYCGVGSITLFVAQYAKEVVGIEVVQPAIDNAIENARINNVTNVSFVCDDAAHYAEILAKQKKRFDVVIVDPPRKGCDNVAMDSIIKMNPKRIVYVSCNPSTLARDIKYMSHYYDCKVVQPVDMFPNTVHVECVALLERRES